MIYALIFGVVMLVAGVILHNSIIGAIKALHADVNKLATTVSTVASSAVAHVEAVPADIGHAASVMMKEA